MHSVFKLFLKKKNFFRFHFIFILKLFASSFLRGLNNFYLTLSEGNEFFSVYYIVFFFNWQHRMQNVNEVLYFFFVFLPHELDIVKYLTMLHFRMNISKVFFFLPFFLFSLHNSSSFFTVKKNIMEFPLKCQQQFHFSVFFFVFGWANVFILRSHVVLSFH